MRGKGSGVRGQKNSHLTWAEVDLKAIKHNLKEIRRIAAQNKFAIPTRLKSRKIVFSPIDTLVVIKADAYGHGMKEVGLLLQKQGIKHFAVSDVHEGMILRKAGIKHRILLLESTIANQVKDIVKYRLTPTVCNWEMAKALNNHLKNTRKRLAVHIKVDTGMGRLGIWHKDAIEFIRAVSSKCPHLIIEGLYTHFSSADSDVRFTQTQLNDLYMLVVQLDTQGLVIPFIHAANSMGLAGYETHVLNVVRPGLMIYGLYPKESLKRNLKLRPALSIYSKVIFLKTVQKGRSISYGRTFIARRKIKVATIPIGYKDGYFRAFSNKAFVIIGQHKCPVIGNVTMDQIMVDVTKVKNVKIGMQVIILGKNAFSQVSSSELANIAHTINYEIVCQLGLRMPRVYKN